MVVTRPLTLFAFNVNVGQKMHFYFFNPLSFALFASAAFDVKRKTAGLVAQSPGLARLGEYFADKRKRSGVSRGIGARGASYGRLVNTNHFIYIVRAFNSPMFARLFARAVKMPGQCFGQNVVYEQIGRASCR